MILGFKPQFVKKIQNHTKIHSIRLDKHNRWVEDRRIQMAIGVRTKNYKVFYVAMCISTQKIVIKHGKGFPKQTGVWIDDKLIFSIDGIIHNGTEMMTQIAKNDGFKNYHEFFKWFSEDFEGKIIHWTDLKY